MFVPGLKENKGKAMKRELNEPGIPVVFNVCISHRKVGYGKLLSHHG